jgi:hypothetical protein
MPGQGARVSISQAAILGVGGEHGRRFELRLRDDQSVEGGVERRHPQGMGVQHRERRGGPEPAA